MSDFSPKAIGGFIQLPSNIEEASSLDDCLAIKCSGSHWVIVPFRSRFLKCRITKKEYLNLSEENYKSEDIN